MSERDDLLASIAHTVRDYRSGEIASPTAAHVDRWIGQFDAAVQLPMLRETDHVLKKTYFSLGKVFSFLRGVMQTENLVGTDPFAFWRGVNFLDIQGGGNSQTEMLALFNELLEANLGYGVAQCGGGGESVFVYLDDGIFTGNRVRRDLETWIRGAAPNKAALHIITIALHSGGHYYANGSIGKAADAAGKTIDVTWWHAIELEDRKAYSDTTDVLRPTHIPNDAAVQVYVQEMEYPPTLRRPGSLGTNALFSSDAGRVLLEQEFLKAGARIRQLCPNLGATQRPLGHITLDTLGFGSLIVTFRNCPNNAPLAIWVGDPWYPLFPRTTNSQTLLNRLMPNEERRWWMALTDTWKRELHAQTRHYNRNFAEFTMTDNGLRQILELESCSIGTWEIDPPDQEITDLSPLTALTRLQYLECESTHITDISPLAKCSSLRVLFLHHAGISNLQSIWSLNLDHLDIQDCPCLSVDEVERYKNAHPDTKVTDDQYSLSLAGYPSIFASP